MSKTTPVRAYPANRVRTLPTDENIRPIYVAVISTSRHYGGPEEGGWWYDWTDVCEVRRCLTLKSAVGHARELREEYPTCPRGRGSVLGGDDTEVLVSHSLSEIEQCQSTERPRYE